MACQPWITELDCCPGSEGLDTGLVDYAISVASEILWVLSGYQVGLCEAEGQYVPRPCYCEPCPGPCEPWLQLDARPVQTVRISLPDPDDADAWLEIPTTDYYVDSVSGEVFATAHLPEPCYGPFLVEWTYGSEVTPAAQLAVSQLACQIAKKCSGQACQLPDRISSIIREGVSFAIIDPMEFLKSGRTGIYAIDLWLSTVAPYGHNSGGHLADPAARRPRQLAGPIPVVSP